MAKKKSKKNMLNLVLAIVVIVLAVVTVCTLFMPVFTSKATVLGSTSTSHIKGVDVITAAFKGETSTDLSNGANSLIYLKNSDDASFVTGLFCWMYFLAVVVSAAIIVFAVLRMFGFRFKLVNTILSIALVALAIVAFICGFVVAGKFTSVEFGGVVEGKTIASVGNYLMLLAVACGGADAYLARQK